MSTIKKIAKDIGVTKLARFLGVSNEMINKSIRKHYIPSDYYHRLVKITNNKYSYDELYNDLYTYKLNYKPQVVEIQISNFLNLNQNPEIKNNDSLKNEASQ